MEPDIITVPVGEPFKRISGLGHSRQYELLNAGELESIMIGRRRLIILESYRRLVERRQAEGKKLPRPGRQERAA